MFHEFDFPTGRLQMPRSLLYLTAVILDPVNERILLIK